MENVSATKLSTSMDALKISGQKIVKLALEIRIGIYSIESKSCFGNNTVVYLCTTVNDGLGTLLLRIVRGDLNFFMTVLTRRISKHVHAA